MLSLRQTAQFLGLGLVALAMTYTTFLVHFSGSQPRAGLAVSASVEPFP